MTHKHYRLHMHRLRRLREREVLDLSELQPEHVECLQHLSHGLTGKEVCEVMQRTRGAFNNWTHRMRSVTGARNLAHLISEALRQNLIQ